MSDWIEPTLLLFPFAAWMFLGVGIPWALALLPRDMWRERALVIAVGMALGPLGYTALMFALGTVGTITLGGTLAGSVLLATIGGVIAWRRRSRLSPPPAGEREQPPLGAIEWLLIGGMVLLLVINVIVAAYWPFLAYDPLWVYARNAKVFVIESDIPSDIGYYPQMLSLSFTTMQQAWGEIDDHAARVVVPWFNTAMVLMAYVLGRLAFGSRRVGLLTAAVWSFYPHVQAWAGAGDLEIPLTLYMTGAAAFFVAAWETERTRLAVLSGLLLAGALWTKPTGGALALGVMLAVVGAMVIARFRPTRIWPKLRIALIAGLASAPIGGMWYVRNLALGHSAVDFPARYWHDYAQRSGQELGWPLLLAALIAGGLALYPPAWLRARGRWSCTLLPLLAMILLLAGSLPTALNPDLITEDSNLWQWARGDLFAGRRLNPVETGALVLGFGLLALAGYSTWRSWPEAQRATIALLWALLLPYGVVWFLYYSYHFRLSFAIVPLLAVQVAALIDGWLWPWLAQHRVGPGIGGTLAVASIALAAVTGIEFSADVWRNGGLPDDRAKYDQGNPALMVVVHMLEEYAAQQGQAPVVAIPGEDRLPFFFPEWDIRNSRASGDLPTTLDDLDGVDIFVGGGVTEFVMQQAGRWPNALLIEAAVGAAYHQISELRTDGMREVVPGMAAVGPNGMPWPTALEPLPLQADGSLAADDGNFYYLAYRVNREALALSLEDVDLGSVATPEGTVIMGDFAQYLGHSLVSLEWVRGQRVFLTLYWQSTEHAPPPQDYSIYIHLLDEDGNLLAGWDGEPLQGQYHTRFWRPEAFLLDYWVLRMPQDIAPGQTEIAAQLRIGIYDPVSGERLPVVADGIEVGDELTINTRITVP